MTLFGGGGRVPEVAYDEPRVRWLRGNVLFSRQNVTSLIVA